MSAIAQRKSDPSLAYISVFVIIAHLVGMMFISINLNKMPVVKPKEHLVVKTIQLGEPRPVPKVLPIEIEQPAPILEEAPAPTIKEEPPKPAPAKKIEEPKPVPEKKKVEKAPVKENKPAVKKEEKKKEVKKETVKKKDTPKKKETVKKKEEKKPVNTAKKNTTTPKKETAKKETPKKTEKKKTETVSKPDPEAEAAKQAVSAKQQELLKNAKESIAKIDKSAHKFTASDAAVSSQKIVPGKIEKLQIEGLPSSGGSKVTFTKQEAGYRDELISRLKLLLRLPEYGEVKVNLTLERSGKVAKVSIVSAESAANKKYIEKTLPTISLPAFGDNFPNQSQYTFVITLSNE